ncbi:transcriptional repressor NsdA [Streptomyces sp. CA-181903]|uniref:transcriptional repressor NsdA n=1 Tax=Streptomyces sp. CA-181903 TaxID=3240055 RepID=UPI003D89FB68
MDGGVPVDGSVSGTGGADRAEQAGKKAEDAAEKAGRAEGPEKAEKAEKRPNEQLNSWFLRSGWSKGELARQVNRRARQLGAHHISTDTSRVRRWLDGEQPREPIPKILSELFSERFGCVVGVEDIGLRTAHLSPSATGVDLPWAAPQTVEMISEFSRSDLMLARRGFLGTSLALSAGSALIEPMQRWLVPTSPVGTAPPAGGDRSRRGRLSKPELDLLESTTKMFRAWDAQCGGGLRRKAVVGQLHEVTDLLQEPQADETSKRLFKVAAELAQLAGWMSYDVGLHPTAQKYFVLALHAAKEAGDRPLGSYVLSSMSRQMIHLGRPEDALELIHLGQYGSRETATPRIQAMLYAMEARAYATMGQPAKTKRAVGMAEDCFSDCAPADGDPDWIRFFSEAELNAENAHSYRDLAYVAGRSPMYASLSRPKMLQAVHLFEEDGEHQRSYALNLIGLATVDLMEREPEASTVHLGKALRIAKQVRSERVNNRLRKTVDTAIRDFGDVDEVRDLTEQLALHLPESVETAPA